MLFSVSCPLVLITVADLIVRQTIRARVDGDEGKPLRYLECTGFPSFRGKDLGALAAWMRDGQGGGFVGAWVFDILSFLAGRIR